MPTRPTWTRDQLREAVQGNDTLPPARSMLQVTNRLGLTQSGPTNAVIRAHAAQIKLALPHRLNDQRRAKLRRLEAEQDRIRTALAEAPR